MTITVLLFAGVREMAHADRLSVELSEGATYADLLRALVDEAPVARVAIQSSRLAADGAFVDMGSVVSNGREIALIPPVSGG
jgi:molybdopterin converting factor small subunit